MVQFLVEYTMRGQVFACTENSEEECFNRLLFGANKVYGPSAMKVKKGDFLFLLNLSNDVVYGIFKATSDAKMNIEPKAWGGRYPYQVRVEPIGMIIPLKNAKKLLKKLNIKRTTRMKRATITRLLELYRPEGSTRDKWLHSLFGTREGKALKVRLDSPRSWSLLNEAKRIERKVDEDIPMLEATTLWDFPKQSYGEHPKGDNKYPGVTPALIIWNLVWRYTEPGDLVLDPMCGSGTTIDVCKEEGRRVIGYDIAPIRPDIIQNDSREIPLSNDSVDLIFVDSPYGDNIRYNANPDCIGKVSSETETFYDELEKVMKECHRVLKKGKVLGWLIGDQWVKKRFTPVGFKVYERLCKYFETLDIVCVTRRGQSSHTGLWYNRARRFNFFLRGFKYLLIMKKVSPDVLAKNKDARKIDWTYYKREELGAS